MFRISLHSTSLAKYLAITTRGVILRKRYLLTLVLVSVYHAFDALAHQTGVRPCSTSGGIECNHRLG